MRLIFIALMLTLAASPAGAISCHDFDDLRARAAADPIYESYFRGWVGGFGGSMISLYTFSLTTPLGALYCPQRYDDGLSVDNLLRHYDQQRALNAQVRPEDCLAETMIILGLKQQFPCR